MKPFCNYFLWILVCSIISVVFSFDDSGEVISTLYKTQISRVDKGVKRPVRFCQGFEDPTEIDCYMRSDIKTYVCTEPVAFNPCESLQRVETFHYDHIIHKCVKVNVPACEGQLIRVLTLLQCLIYCHNKDPFSLGKSRSMVFKLNQAKPYVPREKIEDEREKIMNNAQKKAEKKAASKIEETKKMVVPVIKTVNTNEISKSESGNDYLKKKSNLNDLKNTMAMANDAQMKASIQKKSSEAVEVPATKTLKTKKANNEEAPISSDKKTSATLVEKPDVKETVLKPNIKNDGQEILDKKEGQTTEILTIKDTEEVAKSHSESPVAIPDVTTLEKKETEKMSLGTVLPLPTIKNLDNSADNDIINEVYEKTLNGNADLAEYLLGYNNHLVKKSVPDETQVNNNLKSENITLQENKTIKEIDKKNINPIKIDTDKAHENDKLESSAIKEIEYNGKKAEVVKPVEKNEIIPEEISKKVASDVKKSEVTQEEETKNAEVVKPVEESKITPVEKNKKDESEVNKSEVVDKKKNAEIVKAVEEKKITPVEKNKKDEYAVEKIDETAEKKNIDPIEIDKKGTADTNEIEAIEIKETGNENSKSDKNIGTKLSSSTNIMIKSDSTDQSKDDGFYLWDE